MHMKVFIVFMLVLMIITIWIICIPDKFDQDMEYETIYVARGDTLWGIAEQYKDKSQDIRDYIYEIKKINNMTSSEIYQGQTLTIIKWEVLNEY